MSVDQSQLQERTLEQLLEDFAGVTEPQLKTLNLIWSIFKAIEGGAEVTVSWGDITDKPAVIAAGATQATARTAIGAGTSSLTLAQSQAGIATKPAIAALTSASDAAAIVAALKA